jgi:glycosyltransferase involved in cell wall biosynthesis
VVKEIREKMQELTQYEYDIFLVNDASPDNTMGTIRDLCDKYDNIKGIGFARNFGQHAALMAGLRHSDGDYVVCLDDDGQTPADEVDKLLGSWKRVSMPFTPDTNINSIPHSGIWEARSMS